ncbi:MAG: NUDIX hydrolase [Rhodothermales bacterium]
MENAERRRPAFYYDQSGVIPIRREGDEVQVLLITSRRRKRWIIPKGIIERELGPGASAEKEALEEAGVQGRMTASPIGTYTYRKWGGTCRVQVFILEVEEILGSWREGAFRQRQWMRLEEAAALVDESELKHLILGVPAFLASITR